MSVDLKLRTYTAEQIAQAAGGQLALFGGADGSEIVTAVAIDSREAGKGVLFAAIKGERNDGNDFIPQAVEAGSSCFLCQFVPDAAKSSGKPFAAVIVDDTVAALGKLASEYRNHTKAKFVAVTGSVGKTTTKEFIYAVTSAAFRAYKTQGNYNSVIGLPLTVFGIGPEDEVAVVEMGMSALGEIETMSRIARPDIALVTNIGTSHLASLGTRENICRAKMEIRLGMPEDGILLLNADEPLLAAEAERLPKKPRLLSVYNHTGDFRAVNIRQKPDGIVYDLIYSNKAVTNVEVPALGRHNVYNSLAAYAVGVLLGMTDDMIRRGLKTFVGADMRQNIYDVGGITVIDDCYNASPESMRAAVDVLVAMAGERNARPAALLGDMLELGEYSRLMHDQIGQYVAQMGVQKLFCFGMTADIVAEAAIKKGIRAENVFVCLDTRDAQGMADMILGALEPGDILLVKASRAVAAERVIECMKKRRLRKKK
ncbi:MAG: UDP-N-acetylmuramoyl-tripeptide--D-alanyl-D-alanine ligase [Ruminococcaceae bacterium]|jgi:UDP-N-acetylmuramoyl-tripeptide--D-alanyl-D-alanine ligase|nr:UDP-N-acetylmuramoyl-tripeptide--D-alanyl-D-alanine ligase [Oscillospiraceae bacterium]